MHVQGSRREGVQSQSAVCCMKYQLFGLKFSLVWVKECCFISFKEEQIDFACVPALLMEFCVCGSFRGSISLSELA